VSDRPYTLTGDSRIEAGVRTLLQDITAAVVAELAPAAVVLSGSFARGEGGAYLSGQELRATSDIDLIAVYRGADSVARAALARRRARKLSAKLSRTLARARVDLTTRPAILLRWPATTLDYYELLRSARPLHGAVRLPPPSEVRIDDIPAGEITRLLRKRGAGLLLAWVRFMAADEALSTSIAESVQLDVDKAFLACGDTWLYRHGEYDHRLLVRVERFRRLRSIGVGPTARLHEEYERSAHQRLLPSPDQNLRLAAHRERWRIAVEEWLRCYESHAEWCRNSRNAAPPILARWHPVRAVKHTIDGVRRLVRGLPTEQHQWNALPILLQLALGGGTEDALYAIASGLLRTGVVNPPSLLPLVRGFLRLWHPTGVPPQAPHTKRFAPANGSGVGDPAGRHGWAATDRSAAEPPSHRFAI
jgi:predicted nucleotidyltransferase